MPAKESADGEPFDLHVRRRLRELRTEQGLTLQQVAERASIDLSTLSRLEAGKRRLAIDHLPALASALGVSTDELLSVKPAQDPRVRHKPHRRKGITAWALTDRGAARGLRAYKLRIDAERSNPPDELPVHEGYGWLYVLSGRLRLILDDAEHVIEPGEAAEFSTWTPHWFGALDGEVEVLALMSSQGERVHLYTA